LLGNRPKPLSLKLKLPVPPRANTTAEIFLSKFALATIVFHAVQNQVRIKHPATKQANPRASEDNPRRRPAGPTDPPRPKYAKQPAIDGRGGAYKEIVMAKSLDPATIPQADSWQLYFCGHCPNGHLVLFDAQGLPIAEAIMSASHAREVAKIIDSQNPNFANIKH
jgi:hypothetical protein